MNDGDDQDFTPALGRPEFTQDYDRVIATMTRERRWRSALIAAIALRPGDRIVDFGCGTGSLVIQLKEGEPSAHVIGVDPDPDVLRIAREKAASAKVDVDLRRYRGDRVVAELGARSATVAVSSLVLHQCPLAMKQAILDEMYAVLSPGGRILIADYGLQRTFLMKQLFRQVQMLDGFENTRPNAKGILPELIGNAGFVDVEEFKVVQTPTGSISLYRGLRC